MYIKHVIIKNQSNLSNFKSYYFKFFSLFFIFKVAIQYIISPKLHALQESNRMLYVM